MALTACKQCLGKVSSDSWRCVHCGGRLRHKDRGAIIALTFFVIFFVILGAALYLKDHQIVLDKFNDGRPWAFDKYGVHKELERKVKEKDDDFDYSLGTYYRRVAGGYKAAHRYKTSSQDGNAFGIYVVKADLNKDFEVIRVYEPVSDRIRTADDPYTDL